MFLVDIQPEMKKFFDNLNNELRFDRTAMFMSPLGLVIWKNQCVADPEGAGSYSIQYQKIPHAV
jgi:hypothetical protein